MPRPRKTSNLAAARTRMYRDLVFTSAERVFAEAGFEGATMQDIAAEAGISLKTLYAAYRGKDEIYREIGTERARQFLEQVAGATEGDGGLLERMVRGICAYAEYLVEHHDYFRIQLREGRSWGLDPAGESRTEWRTGLELQTGLIRQGIREGLFHDDDPALMAATAIAIMQVQLAGLVQRSKDPEPALLGREISLQLVRYLCRPEAFDQALEAIDRLAPRPQKKTSRR